MDFHAEFNGAIYIDALEHVFPEDWPEILARFQTAVKSGGVFYFTVEVRQSDEVKQACKRAKAQGLPVVFGELADKIDASHTLLVSLEAQAVTSQVAGVATYHYYPPPDQVRPWHG